ncbi:MAG: hypothetical protein K8U57_24590 [Planctomycetes bacterium]|nr:hypothetical protein [Planctomycetota bacterium]
MTFPVLGPLVAWLAALLVFRGAPYEANATTLMGMLFLVMSLIGCIAWLRTTELLAWEFGSHPTQGKWFVLAAYWELFGGLFAMLSFGTLALWGFLVVMISDVGDR